MTPTPGELEGLVSWLHAEADFRENVRHPLVKPPGQRLREAADAIERLMKGDEPSLRESPPTSLWRPIAEVPRGLDSIIAIGPHLDPCECFPESACGDRWFSFTAEGKKCWLELTHYLLVPPTPASARQGGSSQKDIERLIALGEEMATKVAERDSILSGLGYPWLPCPICNGVEGCDHSVPERCRAASAQAAFISSSRR